MFFPLKMKHNEISGQKKTETMDKIIYSRCWCFHQQLDNEANKRKLINYLPNLLKKSYVHIAIKKLQIKLTTMYKSFVFFLLVIPFFNSYPQQYTAEKLWETDKVFLTPESVCYDQDRDVLYISNFNKFPKRNQTGNEFISKVSIDGEVLNLKWVEGLTAPTGMGILEDKLYVAERGNLVEIDIETGEILKRYPVPKTKFVNDVVIAEDGTVYVSESGNSIIFKFVDGEFEELLSGSDVSRPNGMAVVDDKLIVGMMGTGCVVSINLSNKEVEKLGCFEGKNIVDGVRSLSNDEFIITNWIGLTSVLTKDGKVTELINTTGNKIYSADIEYIIDKNMLIIPTFFDNRVVAYKINKND